MKEDREMNKLFLILLGLVLSALMLISCSDGRCDECGKKAMKMNSETKEVFKDAGLDGDYCEDCFDDALSKALIQALSK